MATAPKICCFSNRQSFQIRRKPNVVAILTNHLLYFAIGSALIAPTAIAFTLFSGTYYAVALSRDFAAVAIDSRSHDLIDPLSPPNDRYCKVYALADSLIFFSTSAATAAERGIKLFDAADNARRAFADNTGKIDLDAIAVRWRSYMVASYSAIFSLHPEYKARFDNTTLISGYFVGLDWQDKMIVAKQKVVFNQPNNFTATPTHSELQTANTAFIQPADHPEILNEFFDNGKTQRARDAFAEWKAQTASSSYVDKMAAQAAMFVEAVRDWGNDKDYGGDIAVMVLERGKKWRWYHRPDFCPEN